MMKAQGNIEGDVILERIEATLVTGTTTGEVASREVGVKEEDSIEEARLARRGRGNRRQTMMEQTSK